VPTINVTINTATTHPKNSKVLSLLLNEAIFHAEKLAVKFAIEPKIMSIIMLGMGLITLEIAHPIETPIIVGHPNIIDNGIKASATRTCTSSKLIDAKAITNTA